LGFNNGRKKKYRIGICVGGLGWVWWGGGGGGGGLFDLNETKKHKV